MHSAFKPRVVPSSKGNHVTPRTVLAILSLVCNAVFGISLLVIQKPFSAAPHLLQSYQDYLSLQQSGLDRSSDQVGQSTHYRCGGGLVLDLDRDVVYCSDCKAVIRFLTSPERALKKSTQVSFTQPQTKQNPVTQVEQKIPSHHNANSRFRTYAIYGSTTEDATPAVQSPSLPHVLDDQQFTAVQSTVLKKIRDRVATRRSSPKNQIDEQSIRHHFDTLF